MVAQIVGFDSRAACGLRKPKRRSTRITPSKGGSVVHHGASKTPSSHAACRATWKQYQKLHMDTNGWVDVAYTGAFCNHGYALAGRGFGIRTGANGTNVGNQNNYAFVFIGNGDDANELAVNALEWWLNEARTKGGAGTDVRPHRYFTGSTCPSNRLLKMTPRWHRKAIQTKVAASKPPAPRPVASGPAKQGSPLPRLGKFTGPHLSRSRNSRKYHGGVKKAQENLILLGYMRRLADEPGRFGDDTERGLIALQKDRGIKANGILGPDTWAELEKWS